jgi:hypothetical protein
MPESASGLQLDFLSQIVNVQWGGGLAVEFGNKAQGPDEPDPIPDGN